MDTVRAVTLNLWGEQPPLAQRMALLVDALQVAQPDVIAFQEVRQIPGTLPNTAETVARALGYHHAFAVATSWGGGDEGLAIVSRLPLVRHEAAQLPHATPNERRIVLGASIMTARGELAVFTTHLNYRLGDGAKREAQVLAVDEFVAAWPSPLPKLLMGDFNATPAHDEIRFLRGEHSLAGRRAVYQDAWARHHRGSSNPGWTWATRNPYTRKLAWLDGDRRLDYVFVTPMNRDGSGVVRECFVILDEPGPEGIFASDHFGLYAEVQLAPT